MNLDIRFQPLGGSRFVQEYLAGDPAVRALFAHDPFALSSFRAQWAAVRGRFFRADRARIASMLRVGSERSARRLDHWVENGGAVVTTGQQAGLFTGPLYTIHKALTAVRLAEALEAALGITVLPVFWVASEDHDWAEVDHAHLVDREGTLHRIGVASDDPRPLQMDQRRFGRDLETALEAASQLVAGEHHAADALTWIRGAYRPGVAVATAFGDAITELLGPLGVAVVDAADPELKRASLPVLRRELAGLDAHAAALAEQAGRIEELGHAPQVPILPGASNLFLRTRLGRERLFRDRHGWAGRESGERFAEPELERLLATQPGRFSPNVLLRPVVESSVFPVLAYVGGPGEVSYFGQTRPLFAAHGIPMPVVYPRASLRVVEPGVAEELDALGVSLEELGRPVHELVTRHHEAKVPAELREALRSLREAVVREFDGVGKAAARVDPTLGGAAGARRNRALLLASELERKVVRAIGRQERGWASRLERVRNHLVPLGEEQERVLNILPLLAAHGRGLLPALAARIAIRWNEPSR